MSSSIASDIASTYTGGITTSTAITGKSADSMDMNDFFKLLTAQMSNQDMMNPESNTEFIAQMAQFSSLKSMQTMTEYSLSGLAASYSGKTVTVATTNETTGAIDKVTGVVENVQFYDGAPKVVINGKPYDLHKVMEVKDPSSSADAMAANAHNALSSASSYIGKRVTVTDASDLANIKDVTGIVSGATLKGGKSYITIGGKDYLVSDISSVSDPSLEGEKATTTDQTNNTTDNKTDDTNTDNTTDTNNTTDDETDDDWDSVEEDTNLDSDN